jgi:K+-sensing histidine kinase KdpD
MTQAQKSRRASLGLSLGLILGLGVVDYMTPFEFHLSLFYALPVAITAWFVGTVPAILTALVSVGVWYCANLLGVNRYSWWFYEYWNTGMYFGWFLLVALTISRIRMELDREKRLNEELTDALAQVKQLKGLLPICAWCKKIRNDQGYWQEVEAYISSHSDAQFSHGICPTCKEHQFAP